MGALCAGDRVSKGLAHMESWRYILGTVHRLIPAEVHETRSCIDYTNCQIRHLLRVVVGDRLDDK
jgi:hypothetical protein